MRRFITPLLAVLITVVPLATGTPASAASAKCTTRGAVTTGKVCLPGVRKGSLTWQTTPVAGKSCLRTRITYKTLICTKAAGKPKWAIKPAATSVEEARAGARAMLAKSHLSYYHTGDVIAQVASWKKIETKYAAYSTKVGSTLAGYYISMQGQKTCYAAALDDPGMTDVAC